MVTLSRAASLALHATALLAGREGMPAAVGELAQTLGVSQNHLAKVMQHLARRQLVASRRGPKGGFVLSRPARQIRLLDVYEAVEGPLNDCACLLPHPVCQCGACIMGGLLDSISRGIREHLERTTLADIDWPHLRPEGSARGGRS